MIRRVRQSILVGEAPSPSGLNRGLDVKLAACARDEVARMKRDAGEFLTAVRQEDPALWEWVRRSGHVNLLDRYPGPRFPVSEGKLAAQDLLSQLRQNPPRAHSVLLAGRSVAACFGVRGDQELLSWVDLQGLRTAVVPHPSGLNRFWNDPAGRDRVLAFLREEGERLAGGPRIAQVSAAPSGVRSPGSP